MIDPVTPGEILLNDFLKPKQLTTYQLCKMTGIGQSRAYGIITNRARMDADTAWRLSFFFPETTAQFWMNLQAAYDLQICPIPKMP